MFELDPRLARDTSVVTEWPLCRVLLRHDANYPWLILVPAVPNLRDLHDLSSADSEGLMREILSASKALAASTGADKINVASLGNEVAQLHVHVIARFHADAAWPRPVWGVVQPRSYGEIELREFLERLRVALA